ncbi:MAG: TolC family protein [Pseudomonadota bacterium]
MKRLASLTLSALLLSGCATSLTVDEASMLAGKTMEIPADWQVNVDPVRAESFAALYDDPVLSAYLDAAMANNYDLEQARLRVIRSDAQLAQFRARRAPQLNSSAGFGLSGLINNLDGATDNANLGLSASFDPDLFGSLRADIKGAEARAEIARAELARLRRIIMANVVSAYVGAIEAQLQLNVAEQNLEFLAETERVTRARFEGGDVAGSDLALSELEVQSARASVAEQRFATDDARRALSILVGGFGDETLAGQPALPDRLPTVSVGGVGLNGTPAELMARRFDVQAAGLAVVDAATGLEGARADDLPGASLSAALSGRGDVSDLFDIDTYIASIGAALAYNIFDAGLNDAQQADAQAALDTALSLYAETLRASLRDIRARIAQVDALEEALVSLRGAEGSAERALELEGVRFDLGESILLDVLTVQRRVDAIRSSRLRTERRHLEAVAQAHLAAGPV